jgi:curli production assembly/transport component CsgG
MEGGIIGYDSNVLTGGAGVRYFGTGVSGQFRKDRVTIYLRAVSTQTGRILKSVRVTKSIISQELSGGLFRYVDANRLLEAEIGVTMNEPPTIAVTAAIDAAVRRLIIKGADEGLWQPKDKEAFKKYAMALKQQHKAEKLDFYGLVHRPDLRSGLAVTANYSFGSYIGSYGNETQNSGVMLQVEKSIIPAVSLKLNLQRAQIGAKQVFSEPVNNADLMANIYLLPYMKFSPYVSAGGGVLAYDKKPQFANRQFYPTLSGEAGIDYRFSHRVGIRAGVNYRYLLDTGLDGMVVGTIHDQQWNIITGISIYL